MNAPQNTIKARLAASLTAIQIHNAKEACKRLSPAQQKALRNSNLRYRNCYCDERTEAVLVREGMIKADCVCELTDAGVVVATFLKAHGVQLSTTITPTARKVLEYMQERMAADVAAYDGANRGRKDLGSTYNLEIAEAVEIAPGRATDALRRLAANKLVEAPRHGSFFRVPMTDDQKLAVESRKHVAKDNENIVRSQLESAGADFSIRNGKVSVSVDALADLLHKLGTFGDH